MKKTNVIILLVMLLLVLTVTAQAAGNVERMLKELRTEKTIKSVAYDNYTLWVGVFNNQGNRNGYAQYVCAVAADFSVKPVRVVVMDIVAWTSRKQRVEIGEARC